MCFLVVLCSKSEKVLFFSEIAWFNTPKLKFQSYISSPLCSRRTKKGLALCLQRTCCTQCISCWWEQTSTISDSLLHSTSLYMYMCECLLWVSFAMAQMLICNPTEWLFLNCGKCQCQTTVIIFYISHLQARHLLTMPQQVKCRKDKWCDNNKCSYIKL